MIRAFAIGGLAVLWCATAFGQTTATPLSFEVADVRASKAGGKTIWWRAGRAGSIPTSSTWWRRRTPTRRWITFGGCCKQLLAERFKLVVHQDTKVVPVYALVVGKSGPKIQESAAGDSVKKGFLFSPDGGFRFAIETVASPAAEPENGFTAFDALLPLTAEQSGCQKREGEVA